MTAEQIYKQVLERLAESGIGEAKLGLLLGKNAESKPDHDSVIKKLCGCLEQANRELSAALSYNDARWTTDTDRSIELAREKLIQALTILALK